MKAEEVARSPLPTCCAHVWSSLQCDGREHYYICARKGCTVREYFSKCTCVRRRS